MARVFITVYAIWQRHLSVYDRTGKFIKRSTQPKKATIMVESYRKYPWKMARLFITEYAIWHKHLSVYEHEDKWNLTKPTILLASYQKWTLPKCWREPIIFHDQQKTYFYLSLIISELKRQLLLSSSSFRKESPPSKMTATQAECYKVLFSYYIAGKNY